MIEKSGLGNSGAIISIAKGIPAEPLSEFVTMAFSPALKLAEVFAEAEAILLAVPHTSETERMIDAEISAAMKSDANLVSIARG